MFFPGLDEVVSIRPELSNGRKILNPLIRRDFNGMNVTAAEQNLGITGSEAPGKPGSKLGDVLSQECGGAGHTMPAPVLRLLALLILEMLRSTRARWNTLRLGRWTAHTGPGFWVSPVSPTAPENYRQRAEFASDGDPLYPRSL